LYTYRVLTLQRRSLKRVDVKFGSELEFKETAV
jgi:hypothetical protein